MQSTIQYIKRELADIYPDSEIESFIPLVFEPICGYSYTDLVLQKDTAIGPDAFKEIVQITERLKKYEPIQYILGETEFHKLTLAVNPSVLIPRPETEELVEWIVRQHKDATPKILDIGTGSGCIALAIKNEIKGATVSGIDISGKALDVARFNARKNKLDVHFIHADILNWENYTWSNYSIIVSNPPYVRNSEKKQMDSNVLNYEPDGALFVPDESPLLFYKKIVEFAKEYLMEQGSLYFEINEALANEMNKMLKKNGFFNVKIKKDINGRERMVCCTK